MGNKFGDGYARDIPRNYDVCSIECYLEKLKQLLHKYYNFEGLLIDKMTPEFVSNLVKLFKQQGNKNTDKFVLLSEDELEVTAHTLHYYYDRVLDVDVPGCQETKDKIAASRTKIVKAMHEQKAPIIVSEPIK